MLAKKSYPAHFSETLFLALPIIAGQLGHVLISIVDNAMVGQLGSTQLAAAGLANSIFFLVFIFSIGLTLAITPLTGEAFGAGDFEKCKTIFKNGLMINLFAGILFTFLGFGSVFLIDLLDQPEEIREPAKAYLVILSLSILPGTLFLHFKQYIEGFGKVIPGMVGMGITVLVNVFLNWVFIYGNLGMPTLGLIGAGFGTLIARTVGFFVIAGWAIQSKSFGTYISFTDLFKPVKKVIHEILEVGMPSSIQYFFEVGAFSGALIMMGWIGKNESAAHNVAIHLASITFMVATGLSAAATIRVSQAKGRGEVRTLRRAGFAAIILGIAFMFISALVFWFGKSLLPSFYIHEPEVLKIASVLMGIAAFFQISDGIQAIGVGALRGLSDAKVPALITFLAYWVIGLPGGYYLGFHAGLGMNGIWYALSLSLTFSAFFLTWRFHFLTRKLMRDTTQRIA